MQFIVILLATCLVYWLWLAIIIPRFPKNCEPFINLGDPAKKDPQQGLQSLGDIFYSLNLCIWWLHCIRNLSRPYLLDLFMLISVDQRDPRPIDVTHIFLTSILSLLCVCHQKQILTDSLFKICARYKAKKKFFLSWTTFFI